MGLCVPGDTAIRGESLRRGTISEVRLFMGRKSSWLNAFLGREPIKGVFLVDGALLRRVLFGEGELLWRALRAREPFSRPFG